MGRWIFAQCATSWFGRYLGQHLAAVFRSGFFGRDIFPGTIAIGGMALVPAMGRVDNRRRLHAMAPVASFDTGLCRKHRFSESAVPVGRYHPWHGAVAYPNYHTIALACDFAALDHRAGMETCLIASQSCVRYIIGYNPKKITAGRAVELFGEFFRCAPMLSFPPLLYLP